MTKFRIITILLIVLFAQRSRCQDSAQDRLKEEYEEQQAMKSYLQQEHRFEIRGCRFLYNEQEVPFEDRKAYMEMFGDNYTNNDGDALFYDLDTPVQFMSTQLIVHMGRYKSKYNHDSFNDSLPILDGYFLFDGIPINKKTRMEYLNRRLMKTQGYSMGVSSDEMAIAYEKEYCYPEQDNTVPRLIYIIIYYDNEYGSEETFDIINIKYEYH